MKKIFLSILIGLFFCKSIYPFDPDVPGGVPVNGLQCTIKADRETYISGEPIIIEYTLKNVGEKPLILFAGDIPQVIYAGLNVISLSDKKKSPLRKLIFWEERDGVAKEEFITLKHNETYITTVDIINWYHTIRYPGKYEITALYRSDFNYYDCEGNPFGSKESIKRISPIPIDAWTGEIKSNSIIIEVMEVETGFTTTKGRIILGMDIKEVKEILGEPGVRRVKDGYTEEIRLDGYIIGKGYRVKNLHYRLYNKSGNVEKAFSIFFYNDKVEDWEILK